MGGWVGGRASAPIALNKPGKESITISADSLLKQQHVAISGKRWFIAIALALKSFRNSASLGDLRTKIVSLEVLFVL